MPKFKCDILNNFQTMWAYEDVSRLLHFPRKRFSITFLHRASRSLPNVIERLARIFEWLSHPWYPYYPPTNWVWKRSICKPQTKGHPHMKNSFCRISGDEWSLFVPIKKFSFSREINELKQRKTVVFS